LQNHAMIACAVFSGSFLDADQPLTSNPNVAPLNAPIEAERPIRPLFTTIQQHFLPFTAQPLRWLYPAFTLLLELYPCVPYTFNRKE